MTDTATGSLKPSTVCSTLNCQVTMVVQLGLLGEGGICIYSCEVENQTPCGIAEHCEEGVVLNSFSNKCALSGSCNDTDGFNQCQFSHSGLVE